MFKVEYYSKFSDEWLEYVAPTWNAHAIRHATKAQAEERMSRLSQEHPNDTFRIMQTA